MTAIAKVIDMPKRSPQVEDGYTRIANELLDALLRARLSSHQLTVALAVIRKTYGYNKKEDDIGLSQLAAMTGIDRSHCGKAVRALVSIGVLKCSEGCHGHTLGINKFYSMWNVSHVAESATPTVAESATPTVAESATPTVAESATPPVAESATTKDNLPKDNHQKTKTFAQQAARKHVSEGFSKFWTAYPKKRNKAHAEKAFHKLAPNADLLAAILAGLDRAKLRPDWLKASGEYIPYPATWLNARGWEDADGVDVVAGFTPEQQAFIDRFNANIGDVCLPVADWSPLSAQLAGQGAASKWDAEQWAAFWRYVRDDCVFKGRISFEWLMNRDNFTRVKRGEFERNAA